MSTIGFFYFTEMIVILTLSIVSHFKPKVSYLGHNPFNKKNNVFLFVHHSCFIPGLLSFLTKLRSPTLCIHSKHKNILLKKFRQIWNTQNKHISFTNKFFLSNKIDDSKYDNIVSFIDFRDETSSFLLLEKPVLLNEEMKRLIYNSNKHVYLVLISRSGFANIKIHFQLVRSKNYQKDVLEKTEIFCQQTLSERIWWV